MIKDSFVLVPRALFGSQEGQRKQRKLLLLNIFVFLVKFYPFYYFLPFFPRSIKSIMKNEKEMKIFGSYAIHIFSGVQIMKNSSFEASINFFSYIFSASKNSQVNQDIIARHKSIENYS